MKFRVAHHLKLDGKEYGPGDSISLSADEAARCGSALELWSAGQADEKAEKKKADEDEKKKAEEEQKAADEAAKKKATD